MGREGIAKNQHYVPRFILKRFVERKDQIWVFDKRTKKKFKTNIKNIAAETGFYDFTFEDVELTYEPFLGHVEGNASVLLKKIARNESLSVLRPETRALLSNFLALQFVRTPQWRYMWDGLGEAMATSLIERGSNLEEIEGFETPTKEKTKLEHMRQIYNHGEFASHFFDKTWVLLKTTEKDPFWISDNPIALQNMNDFGFYGNIGLAVKGIEIYFPISRTLSLGMWCSSHEEQVNQAYEQYSRIKHDAPWLVSKVIDDPSYIESLKSGIDTGAAVPSKHDNVINHNSLQVKHSSRFVFSSDSDFSLLEEMLEAHPHMREGPKFEVS